MHRNPLGAKMGMGRHEAWDDLRHSERKNGSGGTWPERIGRLAESEGLVEAEAAPPLPGESVAHLRGKTFRKGKEA